MASNIPIPETLVRAQGGGGARLLAQAGLAVYAFIAALVLFRTLYLSVGIGDSLWVGNVVYTFTDPLAAVFKLLPGGDFELVGRLTVGDITVFAIIAAVPMVLMARKSV